MEIWETVREILGKSRPARLMTLGIFPIVTGGGGLEIAHALNADQTVPALLLVFGILSFISGFADYAEGSGKTRRRKSRR